MDNELGREHFINGNELFLWDEPKMIYPYFHELRRLLFINGNEFLWDGQMTKHIIIL